MAIYLKYITLQQKKEKAALINMPYYVVKVTSYTHISLACINNSQYLEV